MTDAAPLFTGPITFEDVDPDTLAREDADTRAREDADTLAREQACPAETSPTPGAWRVYLNRMLPPPVTPYSAAWA